METIQHARKLPGKIGLIKIGQRREYDLWNTKLLRKKKMIGGKKKRRGGASIDGVVK